MKSDHINVQMYGEPDRDAPEVTDIECPCCGDVGAESDSSGLYSDGQALVCGCPGQVSLDTETDPYIQIHDDEPCPKCDTERSRAGE